MMGIQIISPTPQFHYYPIKPFLKPGCTHNFFKIFHICRIKAHISKPYFHVINVFPRRIKISIAHSLGFMHIYRFCNISDISVCSFYLVNRDISVIFKYSVRPALNLNIIILSGHGKFKRHLRAVIGSHRFLYTPVRLASRIHGVFVRHAFKTVVYITGLTDKLNKCSYGYF